MERARIVWAASLALVLVACGGNGSAEPSEMETPTSPQAVGTEAPGATVPERECSEGGVPDDGDAEACDFRVEGCCYPDATHACRAAGCAPGACTVMESYPAQVACQSGEDD
jgi:hypothetical protein